MSPQRSNRSSLIDGTLRCLERLPPERVTARAIAAESGANLASITYHFGSKDDLVTEAVIEGLDRWLDEIDRAMGELAPAGPRERFRRAGQLFEASRRTSSRRWQGPSMTPRSGRYSPRDTAGRARAWRPSSGWAMTAPLRTPPGLHWPSSTG
jgi:AcrR family transcriptional regulator